MESQQSSSQVLIIPTVNRKEKNELGRLSNESMLLSQQEVKLGLNCDQILNSVLSLGSLQASCHKAVIVRSWPVMHIYMNIYVYIWIYTYSCPYSGTCISEIADCPFPWCFQNAFFTSDEVEMAPVCRNEWRMGSSRWRRQMLNDGPWPWISRRASWFLVTDTHLPRSQTVCLAFLSCSGSQVVYHPISDPTRGAEIMAKSSQIKIHPCALLQRQKRSHISVSECVRDSCGLGMGCQWLEREGWLP